jgi:hypothetical protein
MSFFPTSGSSFGSRAGHVRRLAPAFAAALLCIAVLATARSASAQRYVVVYGPPPPPPPPPTRYYYAAPVDDGPEQALNIGIDLEGAAPLGIATSPDGNSVQGGGGLKVRIGESFRLAPGLRIVPEVGWGYDHLFATDDLGNSYDWDMHRLFGGARLEFGRFLVPILYAHAGYGWRNSGDSSVPDVSGVAFDVGGALDLRLFPHLALGAHLEYATISATPYEPEWIAAGVHADITF